MKRGAGAVRRARQTCESDGLRGGRLIGVGSISNAADGLRESN